MKVNGEKIRNTLAYNIKVFREHHNWSQAELAENSDISIPFLSEIERGNKWPSPETLAKIANALNVPIQELFWEKKSPKKERDYAVMVVNELLTTQKSAAEKIIKQYLS